MPLISKFVAGRRKWSNSREGLLRYLFDFTLSAQWSGPDVGIVRVERELARRARRHLGDQVAFCFYDPFQQHLFMIDDSVLNHLIDGRVRLDLAGAQNYKTSRPRGTPSATTSINETVRRLYHRLDECLFRKNRPKKNLVAELATGTATPSLAVPSCELADRPARLDADTMIIATGLDWEFGSLRTLSQLKHTYRFFYCAVVYDLIPIFFPHFAAPGYLERLTDHFSELALLCDHAMCISESTRNDWLRYCHSRGFEPQSSTVFPLGCELAITTGSETCLPEKLVGRSFVLYVSTIEPRKNHRVLYEAWDECIRLRQVDPDRDRLVFVGRRGWNVDDLLREIATNPSTRETIVILPDVSDALLALLYRSCTLFVFPSFCEGYGLPLAEALAHGKCSVISSSSEALSELAGNLAVQIAPKDTLGWSKTIARLMSSECARNALEARIRSNYRPTTWDVAALRFFSSIKELSAG